MNSIDFNQKRDQKLIKIAIDDTILMLESELLYNRRPNLVESNFELSMIRFGDTNCLSLMERLPRDLHQRFLSILSPSLSLQNNYFSPTFHVI